MGICWEDVFKPAVHLNYSPPSSTFSMEDLGLTALDPSMEIAGSVPFPLLSHEGVLAYRRAMKKALEACAYQYDTRTLILRNLAKHSKFIRDLWSHPETTKIVSEVAGIPLTVVMPIEMGHTNIQTNSSTIEEMMRELQVEPSTQRVEMTEEANYDPLADSVVPWHYDSYPYVCVLMLSDTTSMIGGETYIKRGDGSPMKIEGPSLGYCVILQGGQIEHLAARAFGTAERITTITSYRANVDGLYDNSYLSNVRPYSKADELYREWTSYRLEKLQYELHRMQGIVLKAGVVPIDALNEFVDNHVSYLQRTVRQMICPTLGRRIVDRFGMKAVYEARTTWERIRNHPRFEKLLPAAMQLTENMPLFSRYLTDWDVARGAIARGKILRSYCGPLSWDRNVAEYTFGDELVRQGHREVLLAWLEQTGLLDLNE